ncbi:MAG: triose-phosphate isomerase [Chitinophagales bacterium]
MREKIVIGNWKMNTSFSEAKQLVEELNKANKNNTKTAVLVPSLYINALQNLANKSIHIGAQNVSSFEKGAFTGEISAAMLNSMQVEYVAIGHSERRTIFNETDNIISEKIKISLENNLKPILCCGEALEVRKAGDFLDFVGKQIDFVLEKITANDMKNIIIAYEPIWAIGTGETASAAQAQEVHIYIRNIVKKHFGNEIADKTTILYGGSVKPSNAAELFAEQDIDGALVGGASLNAQSFIDIINANNG